MTTLGISGLNSYVSTSPTHLCPSPLSHTIDEAILTVPIPSMMTFWSLTIIVADNRNNPRRECNKGERASETIVEQEYVTQGSVATGHGQQYLWHPRAVEGFLV
jgi:hypothetical protein